MQAAILNRIELPDTFGTVTLYDGRADEFRDGRNLIRNAPDGHEIWRAKPVESGADHFVKVALEGSKLIAWTWSCFRVEINFNTGALENPVFTK